MCSVKRIVTVDVAKVLMGREPTYLVKIDRYISQRCVAYRDIQSEDNREKDNAAPLRNFKALLFRLSEEKKTKTNVKLWSIQSQHNQWHTLKRENIVESRRYCMPYGS